MLNPSDGKSTSAVYRGINALKCRNFACTVDTGILSASPRSVRDILPFRLSPINSFVSISVIMKIEEARILHMRCGEKTGMIPVMAETFKYLESILRL